MDNKEVIKIRKIVLAKISKDWRYEDKEDLVQNTILRILKGEKLTDFLIKNVEKKFDKENSPIDLSHHINDVAMFIDSINSDHYKEFGKNFSKKEIIEKLCKEKRFRLSEKSAEKNYAIWADGVSTTPYDKELENENGEIEIVQHPDILKNMQEKNLTSYIIHLQKKDRLFFEEVIDGRLKAYKKYGEYATKKRLKEVGEKLEELKARDITI